jgi:hypothetical protein
MTSITPPADATPANHAAPALDCYAHVPSTLDAIIRAICKLDPVVGEELLRELDGAQAAFDARARGGKREGWHRAEREEKRDVRERQAALRDETRRRAREKREASDRIVQIVEVERREMDAAYEASDDCHIL